MLHFSSFLVSINNNNFIFPRHALEGLVFDLMSEGSHDGILRDGVYIYIRVGKNVTVHPLKCHNGTPLTEGSHGGILRDGIFIYIRAYIGVSVTLFCDLKSHKKV